LPHRTRFPRHALGMTGLRVGPVGGIFIAEHTVGNDYFIITQSSVSAILEGHATFPWPLRGMQAPCPPWQAAVSTRQRCRTAIWCPHAEQRPHSDKWIKPRTGASVLVMHKELLCLPPTQWHSLRIRGKNNTQPVQHHLNSNKAQSGLTQWLCSLWTSYLRAFSNLCTVYTAEVKTNSPSQGLKTTHLLLLLEMLRTFQRSVFVRLINTVLLLGAPLLQAWWIKIPTYSQTSVHERLGSWTIRFTNKFSENKASRVTYCVSGCEHASRQHRGAISWEYQRRQYT
jgi:hypothetical protein